MVCHSTPKRIISLVPSQTELLADLGLENEIAGITKFCVHPETVFRTKTRIGGTKKLNFSQIESLNPDLILANKEENVKEQVEKLMKDYPVWISDVNDVDSALEMIKKLGAICGKADESSEMAAKIEKGFLDLKAGQKISVAYIIWQNPLMTVGGDTFIHDMLERSGFENVFKQKRRYPETTIEEIQSLEPDFVFLSSEPYPFKEKHKKQFLENDLKATLVDGEFFSWYGSRMLQAVPYFKELQSRF